MIGEWVWQIGEWACLKPAWVSGFIARTRCSCAKRFSCESCNCRWQHTKVTFSLPFSSSCRSHRVSEHWSTLTVQAIKILYQFQVLKYWYWQYYLCSLINWTEISHRDQISSIWTSCVLHALLCVVFCSKAYPSCLPIKAAAKRAKSPNHGWKS